VFSSWPIQTGISVLPHGSFDRPLAHPIHTIPINSLAMSQKPGGGRFGIDHEEPALHSRNLKEQGRKYVGPMGPIKLPPNFGTLPKHYATWGNQPAARLA
jgi:hypothetical protein